MAKKQPQTDNRTAEEIGVEIVAAMDKQFHTGDDRGIAILGAAYLDSLLETLLSNSN